jgi:hypothetical protein
MLSPKSPFLPHYLPSPLIQPLHKSLIFCRTALPLWLPEPLKNLEIHAALLCLHIQNKLVYDPLSAGHTNPNIRMAERILIMPHPDSPTELARFVSTRPGCTHETQISPSPFCALAEPEPYVLCMVSVCKMLASSLCPYRDHGPLSLSDRSLKLMPPVGAPKRPDEVRLTRRTLTGGSVLVVLSIRGSRCSVKTQCAR